VKEPGHDRGEGQPGTGRDNGSGGGTDLGTRPYDEGKAGIYYCWSTWCMVDKGWELSKLLASLVIAL
jgi:hypothetical protein